MLHCTLKQLDDNPTKSWKLASNYEAIKFATLQAALHKLGKLCSDMATHKGRISHATFKVKREKVVDVLQHHNSRRLSKLHSPYRKGSSSSPSCTKT
mmetsp:Transcript_112696/g.230649  ORF Transcript_112696/g.230649 Transcript_112696/m.230649 type:complete len:97 (-) Transcript_112696:15-305(-)